MIFAVLISFLLMRALDACSPQMKAIQESINTPCVKCSEVVVDSANCSFHADELLAGGQCGQATIDYSLDSQQCAQARLLCSPNEIHTVRDGRPLPLRTVWSSDGFIGDGRAVLELARKDGRGGGALSELKLVCNQESQWQIDRSGSLRSLGGQLAYVAIPNPVTLYCLSGSARVARARVQPRDSDPQYSDSQDDSSHDESSVTEPRRRAISNRLGQVSNPSPTFSIPFGNQPSTLAPVDPNSLRNLSNALLPLLELFG